MPFLRSTMLEVHRCSHFVPMAPTRIAAKDIPYRDWIIPKGSSISWNIHPVCMDKAFWGDPDIFRPDRFLDPLDADKLIPQLAERVCVFGFGKKTCANVKN
jgi:methyl farnesoate epoxidase/farnesoate epoxidase